MFFLKSKKNRKLRNKGFTLIELILVLGIFSILTAVTVYSYGDFNNNIILTNLAYEVALEIRQAQVYSISVRSSDLPNSTREKQFDASFGVYINPGTSPTGIVFFSDSEHPNGWCNAGSANTDCLFTPQICGTDPGKDECRHVSSLTRGITFENICAANSISGIFGENGNCATNAETLNSVAITFKRPNPESIILDNKGRTHANVGIVLKANEETKRAVIVSSTGQISVIHIH